MEYTTLLFESADGIARITVNRPDKLNALNNTVLAELSDAVGRVESDQAILGAIVTGAGPKAFVAGADIGEIGGQGPTDGKARALRGQRIFRRLEQCGKPVIAAVNGFALGGGCELAMACTIRLAADHARFGQPEINLGLIPGYAGSQRLPRLVGKGVALEVLLTGDMITAQRACEIGLVNRVVPAAELLAEAKKLAHALAAKAPIAVRYIIDAVNHGLESSFSAGAQLETSLFGTIASSEDMREGTKAFLDKRKAVWQGK
jgi:enoyl-CoA hydratase